MSGGEGRADDVQCDACGDSGVVEYDVPDVAGGIGTRAAPCGCDPGQHIGDNWCWPGVVVVAKQRPNLLNTWKKGQDPDGAFLVWIDNGGVMWEADSPADLADMLARISDSPVDPWAELVDAVGRSWPRDTHTEATQS